MPRPKPVVRRFGQVDFDSMIPLASADDADIFVCRRGDGGNVTLTRAQIAGAAGGDVFKVGVPVNNQVGVWTGDGTIEGTNGLQFDTVNGLRINATGGILMNDAASPGNIGFAKAATGVMRNIGSSGTVPSIVPNKSDLDTGLGLVTFDALSLIAGGVQIAQVKETVGANQFIVAPGVVQNNPAAPSLALGDGDTGFMESADDNLIAVTAGADRFFWAGTVYGGLIGTSAAMHNVVSSFTVPTITPNRSDLNTGLGADGFDSVSMIAGGVEGFRVSELGGNINTIRPFGPLQAPDGIASSPSYSFFQEGNAGLFRQSGGVFMFSIGGFGKWVFRATSFDANQAGGPRLMFETASATNPTLIASLADTDTGIGGDGADALTMIAGGVDCINIAEIGGARAVGLYTTAAIVQQTGVAVTAAAIHAALVNLGAFTA